MMTGPSVGPGMLLTVLMRWPALIAVLAIGGAGLYGYKEYGLPEPVEVALNKWIDKPIIDAPILSDSNKTKVIDHLAEASAPQASAPEPELVATLQPMIVVAKKESKPEVPKVEKYKVLEGDSLSKIAVRRSSNVVVQRILMARMFNDNPHAFKDEDPNQLRADVEITVPLK